MSTYNQKFNKDDSVLRHIIIGFLADINNKVYFYRQMNANDRVVVDVPFYYSITGDDQFLRDQFLFTTASGPDCTPDRAAADTNYDIVPRGVANLSSMSIDSAKLVNKRTPGSYTKMNSEGAMEGYTAEFNMVPIVLSFDIEILVSSTLDAFKITESIIKGLYKSNYFNVEVGHLEEGTYRIASYYAFPEDYTQERPLAFTFDDKEQYKITFPVEVNSFIPSFNIGGVDDSGGMNTTGTILGNGGTGSGSADPNVLSPSPFAGGSLNSTERHNGNRMFEIETNVANLNSSQENIRIIDENDIDNA